MEKKYTKIPKLAEPGDMVAKAKKKGKNKLF